MKNNVKNNLQPVPSLALKNTTNWYPTEHVRTYLALFQTKLWYLASIGLRLLAAYHSSGDP